MSEENAPETATTPEPAAAPEPASDSTKRRPGWIPAVAVVAVLGVIVGLGQVIWAQPEQRVAPAITAEPIRSSVLLCPEPGTGGNLGVRVSAAIVPGQPGQDSSPGEAGLRTLPGAESASSNLKVAGELGRSRPSAPNCRRSRRSARARSHRA
jgi:hypothetical protein